VEETGKEKKRKSYTFGHSFTKSNTSKAGAQLLPVSKHKGVNPTARLQRDAGDLPFALAAFLKEAKTFEMDIDKVKRLRFLLAGESSK
jgi:hypothetical protein